MTRGVKRTCPPVLGSGTGPLSSGGGEDEEAVVFGAAEGAG